MTLLPSLSIDFTLESGFSGDDGRTSLFDYCPVPSIQNWVLNSKFDEARLAKETYMLYIVKNGVNVAFLNDVRGSVAECEFFKKKIKGIFQVGKRNG